MRIYQEESKYNAERDINISMSLRLLEECFNIYREYSIFEVYIL